MRAELPPGIRAAAEAAKGFMPPAEGQALYETAAAYAGAGPIAGDRHLLRQVHDLPGRRGPGGRAAGDHRRPPPRLGGEPAGLGVPRHRRWSTRPPGGWTRCRTSARRWPRRAGGPGHRGRRAGPRRWPRLWRTPLGMLFIDGGHTEAAADADYDGWVAVAGRAAGRWPSTTCSPTRPTAARPPYRDLPAGAGLGRVHRGPPRRLAAGARTHVRRLAGCRPPAARQLAERRGAVARTSDAARRGAPGAR